MGIVADRTISSKVREFLGSPRKMLIDGEWVAAASGKTFPVHDPATGDVFPDPGVDPTP